jgi:uncharacterized protein (TIGR00251 family)
MFPEQNMTDSLATYLRAGREGYLLSVRAQPGAKKTEIAGDYNGAVKIKLAAPPVDGKANEALCRFVAEALGVPKSAVSIKSGASSRDKVVVIAAKLK